MPIFTHANV